MHFEDLLSAHDIRVRHDYLAIETPGPQQRRVEHIRSVRGGDDDHADVITEAIHFHQDLIERLLALVIGVAQSSPAATSDGVNFVDEHDTRGTVAGFFEQVAHTTRADADEHLDEFGPRDPEKRHACFAGYGPRQEGLARPRWA